MPTAHMLDTNEHAWTLVCYDGHENERTLYSGHVILWPIKYDVDALCRMPPIETIVNRFMVLQA